MNVEKNDKMAWSFVLLVPNSRNTPYIAPPPPNNLALLIPPLFSMVSK